MLREARRALVSKYIVAHIPDEMAACLDCGAVQCLNSQYETCPGRLAEVAVLRAHERQNLHSRWRLADERWATLHGDTDRA